MWLLQIENKKMAQKYEHQALIHNMVTVQSITGTKSRILTINIAQVVLNYDSMNFLKERRLY